LKSAVVVTFVPLLAMSGIFNVAETLVDTLRWRKRWKNESHHCGQQINELYYLHHWRRSELFVSVAYAKQPSINLSKALQINTPHTHKQILSSKMSLNRSFN